MSNDLIIGTQIPWQQVDGCILVALRWTSMSTESNGKVSGPPGLPYASVHVRLVCDDRGSPEEDVVAVLPVAHREDYRVLRWVFEDSGLSDEYEIDIGYRPPRLLAFLRARFSISVNAKGYADWIANRTDTNPDPTYSGSVWSREPGGGFHPPW